MNLDLMLFILEIICLKNKGWGLCNKLDEYADVGTHQIALFCKSEIVYFDSFKEFVKNKNIKANIF